MQINGVPLTLSPTMQAGEIGKTANGGEGEAEEQRAYRINIASP